MWKSGQNVMIECQDRRVPGIIRIASSNGVSLMIQFEAILDGHLGMMPLLRGPDGVYRSIMTNVEVTLSLPVETPP